MAADYPKMKYKAGDDPRQYVYAVLTCEDDEASYADWVDSPMDLGIETCPARTDVLPPDVKPEQE